MILYGSDETWAKFCADYVPSDAPEGFLRELRAETDNGTYVPNTLGVYASRSGVLALLAAWKVRNNPSPVNQRKCHYGGYLREYAVEKCPEYKIGDVSLYYTFKRTVDGAADKTELPADVSICRTCAEKYAR